MSNVIQVKRSLVPGRIPTTVQVSAGELAINTADGKLYYSTGTEVVLVAKDQDIPPNTLAQCTDVSLTAVADNDILRFDGTSWINSAPLPSSASTVLASWTAVADKFYSDFTHSLDTDAVIVSVFDNNTNQLVMPHSVEILSTNVVRITISGPTRALRTTVIANGMSVGGGNSVGTLIIQNTFANRPTAGVVDRLFLSTDTKVLYRDSGSSWEVMIASSGAIRSMSYFATSVDSPNTADFPINAIASAIPDTISSSMNVRSFSQTVEQGVAVILPVPVGASTMRFIIRGRAATTPTGSPVVQHRIYIRRIPDNAVMPSWSAATNFTAFPVPLNLYWQKIDQAFSISGLGMSNDATYQLELTRNVGVANNLASDWLVSEITVVFE